MPVPAIDTIEHVHERLDLTCREIARGNSVDESALPRWRSGAELLRILQRGSPDAEQARAWLDAPLPAFGERTPRKVLMDGRPDLLTGLLLALQESAGADFPTR